MFTQEQLDAIKFAAKKTKNQGELAVANYLNDMEDKFAISWGIAFQFDIIQYCAEECKRQRSGEMSVYDMVNAWNFAMGISPSGRSFIKRMTIAGIEHIGILVEPIDNAKGFRTIPIGVTDGMGGWIEKAQWAEVPRLLEHLLASYYAGYMTPVDGGYSNPLSKTAEDEFYFNYEEIHPFVDGNGRSGKILYNYLCGTLKNPIMPPNFWGSSNP